jgi:chemotaxis protein methyltransferase CheR
MPSSGSSGSRGTNRDDEGGFALLKKAILRDTGLACGNYKDGYLRRRIGARMRAVGAGTYAEYVRLLDSEQAEREMLLDDITINVTAFFRDSETFRVLEEEVVPAIVYEKAVNNRRMIRFWSAGCSSGEEAYSLAIILRHLLGDDLKKFVTTVQGTDIDDACLRIAKRGEYFPEQVENVRPEFLRDYFTFDGEAYKINEDIDGMMRFVRQDLFENKKPGYFDLISCRNVLIYLSKDMQDRLFMEFFRALNRGGYLVIGKTETIFGEARDRFATVSGRERIYRKVEK